MTRTTRLTILSLVLAACASAFASPPPAKAVLAEAESRARADHKNVLVLFHASWCHWCHEMQNVMDRPEIKPIFDQNFEIVWLTVLESDDKKADENQGGEEVMASLGGANQGIPFYGILDADGKAIVSSMAPQANKPSQNIGCPSEPEERAYFRQMLKQGAPKITDAQLAAVDKAFADRSVQRTVETDRLKHLASLQKASDFSGLIKEVESLKAQFPAWAADNKTSLDGYSLRAYVHLNPDKAYELATKAKGSPEELSFSTVLATEPGQEKRFYYYAIEVLTANRAEARRENRKYPYLSTLAKAHFLAGNAPKASELQQEYIADVKEMLTSRSDIKPEMREKIISGLEKQLKEYQDAVAKK